MNNQINYVNLFIVIVICVLFFSGIAIADGRPKIGLALGSGGARGYAHIGVLKILENKEIDIDFIAGSSVGSFVGALYALGFDINEIEKNALEYDFTEYIDFNSITFELKENKDKNILGFLIDMPELTVSPRLFKGLISTVGIRNEFDRISNLAHFEKDLKIPFKAVATDLITGEKIIIDEGKVSNAVAASISIPGIFSPFEFEDKLLVDGGLKDPVPVDVVREMGADIVIAVSLQNIVEEKKEPHNIFSIADRSIDIMIEDLTKLSLKDADIILEPNYLGEISFLMDKKERVKIIKAGEDAATEKMSELKKIIANF